MKVASYGINTAMKCNFMGIYIPCKCHESRFIVFHGILKAREKAMKYNFMGKNFFTYHENAI